MMNRRTHHVFRLIAPILLGCSLGIAAPDDRFHGGSYDGSATAIFGSYTPPTGGQLGRFIGGGYDGHAVGSAPGQSNPLDGDSDGDGVPDWWESANYLSLTLADANTDLDGDGNGSLKEYHADTDPNDPLSRLAIIGFGLGTSIELECALTSLARRYWIEASPDQTPGSWSPVTSPAISGNGGMLEFSIPNGEAERTFFRVRVALPE
jgi:hypothetical protein